MKKVSERVFVSKTDERFIVDVVAPGYKKDGIKVVVANEGDNGVKNYFLKISATKESVADESFGVFKALGKFKEKVSIDSRYDADKVSVAYINGILRITAPITDARKGREIYPENPVSGDAPAETEED